MFALAVDYLTSRAVATSFYNRERPEWPPHPSRLFSALVAVLEEAGGAADERAVLQWLERQGPPALAASSADPRPTQASFVPVNDSNHGFERRGSRLVVFPPMRDLPLQRNRQPRTFPSVTPQQSTVYFIWPATEMAEPLRPVCEALLRRVAYVGHSSSLVSVRLCSDPPPPTLMPSEDGDIVLRVPLPGQLEALAQAHRTSLKTGVRGQLPCGFQAYRRTTVKPEPSPERRGVFEDMVIFRRREGRQIPLTACVRVTSALRNAVMAACDEPVPEIVSGHNSGGAPSQRPHLAFIPLPDVGHRHADGHLLGVAAVLPRELDGAERLTVLRALALVERLTMGAAGAWTVERATLGTPLRALQTETWTQASTRWASVTPVMLDAYPKEPYGPETEAIVATSCERVGLPAPTGVLVTPQSIVLGVPPWHSFLPPYSGGRPRRPLVHIVVTFGEPVRGPILLGAGRYRGLGLCRPVRVGDKSRENQSVDEG